MFPDLMILNVWIRPHIIWIEIMILKVVMNMLLIKGLLWKNMLLMIGLIIVVWLRMHIIHFLIWDMLKFWCHMLKLRMNLDSARRKYWIILLIKFVNVHTMGPVWFIRMLKWLHRRNFVRLSAWKGEWNFHLRGFVIVTCCGGE